MAPSPLAQSALFPPADGKNHTWPAPNYANSETRNWTAPACLIGLFIITSGVFFARLWSRFRITRTAGIDDWLIIASMPVLLGQVIATVLALRIYGFQLHIYDQTPHTYITVRQITLAMEVIYLATITLTKTSILTFYRRMSPSLISRPIYITIWASIIFVVAYGIAFVFVLIFTCWPVEAYWYRFTTSWLQTHHYTCHDELTTLVVIIPISAAQDIIACLLPMFVVRKLKLQLMQKLGLSVIFGVGLIICATDAFRVYLAWRVYHYTKIRSPTYDITWDALGSWVCTTVEVNLAISCASAPALSVYFPCFRRRNSENRSFGWYGRRQGSGIFTVTSAS